jgi:hypothetical protein
MEKWTRIDQYVRNDSLTLDEARHSRANLFDGTSGILAQNKGILLQVTPEAPK